MINSIIPGSYMLAIVEGVYFNPKYTNQKTGEVTEAAWKAQIKTAVLKGEDTQKRELNDINLKMDEPTISFFKNNIGKLVAFQFGTYSIKSDSGQETAKGFTLKQGVRLFTVAEFANELFPRELKSSTPIINSPLK
ncbi:MAG: hypothetical protein ACH34X_08840 [Thiolinea sp.]